MKDFKIKKFITAEHTDCNEYLIQIHEYIDWLFKSPTYKLIESYQDFTNSIADDMKKVSRGDVDNLLILTNQKDDKAFERSMMVLKSVDSFEKIAKLTEDFKPTIEELEKKEIIKIPKGTNPMESITRQKVLTT